MKTEISKCGVVSRQVSPEPIAAVPGHFHLQSKSTIGSAKDPLATQHNFDAILAQEAALKLRNVLNVVLAEKVLPAEEGHEKEVNILYVNADYCDEVTLNCPMGADIDSFGDITWREFIEDCRHENISEHEDCLEDWLDEDYGITPNQLDEKLDQAAIDRYYSDLAYRQDNETGGNVEAFKLIQSLELFPMDRDGNGSSHGVTLSQSTADGPRKYVWIDDQASADWLIQQAAERGVLLTVVFR